MSIFNILFLVFWTFFLASATLEIFYYIKKTTSKEHVFNPCMHAFLLISSLMILIPNIPDSINIVLFLSVALLTALAGSCIQFFPKNRKNTLFSCLLFFTGFLCYAKLIAPSFRLFSLPVWLTLLIWLVYGGLIALYHFFVIGKRSSKKTVVSCVFFIPLIIFHYGTILTVIGQPKLYSIILFIGCNILTASQVLIVKGFFIKAAEKERLIRMILYVTGQFFVAAGYTLMVTF